VAIDYYGRTAGTDLAGRGPDFPFMEHLFQTKREQLFADIHAGIDRLRGEGAAEVCALGFCFGGRLAFLAAAEEFGLKSVAGFYGYPGELFGAPGPTQLAAGFTAGVLGLFGGADEGIPAEVVAEFGAALTASGVPHELTVYPGMPHGFFDHTESGNPTVCADSWSRVLASFKGAGGEPWRTGTSGAPHSPQ
jgi:carboxymethylenebutenolidase